MWPRRNVSNWTLLDWDLAQLDEGGFTGLGLRLIDSKGTVSQPAVPAIDRCRDEIRQPSGWSTNLSW